MKKMLFFLLMLAFDVALAGLPPPATTNLTKTSVLVPEVDKSVTVENMQNTLPTFLAELNEPRITAELTLNQIIKADETGYNRNDNQMGMLQTADPQPSLAAATTSNNMTVGFSLQSPQLATAEGLCLKKVISLNMVLQAKIACELLASNMNLTQVNAKGTAVTIPILSIEDHQVQARINNASFVAFTNLIS